MMKTQKVLLTKLVLGLYRFVRLYVGSVANPVLCTDSEQVQRVLLEAGHCVLNTVCAVGGQSPGLALHIASLHHIAGDLAAAVTLRLLPRQADLAISGVDDLQILYGSRDI